MRALLPTTLTLAAAFVGSLAPLASESRAVKTRPSVLRDAAPGQRVPIRLGPDLRLIGTVQRTVTSSYGSRVVRGIVESVPGTQFVLVVHGDAVAGTVYSPTKPLRVIPVGSGYSAVIEADSPPTGIDFLEMDFAAAPHEIPGRAPASSRLRADSDSPVIDLVVLFTKKALQEIGSRDALISLLELQIADANLALENSGVDGSVRLVGVKPARYNESEDLFDVHRDHVQETKLNKRSRKFSRRFGAEYATVIAATESGCGWATIPGPAGIYQERDFLDRVQAIKGFSFKSTISAQCLQTVPLILAHELGHNLANCHEHEEGGGGPCRPYARGHRLGIVGTVMVAAGRRIPHFSNPAVEYSGIPTGVPRGEEDPADAARNLRRVLPIASQIARCKVDCEP